MLMASVPSCRSAPMRPGGRGGAPSAAVAAAPRPFSCGQSPRPVRRSAARAVQAAAGSEAEAAQQPAPLVIPRGPQDQVQQAARAVQQAWEAGVTRQRLELLLPLIGATDLDDWPGGIRQQFKAAQPMVEELLRALKALPGLEGPLSARIIDDGDAVAAWEGARLAAVLFPTGETLGREVRRIAEARKDGLVLLINPQWTTQGNVISDLGVLPWQRKANEELAASFQETYVLKQQRINGDDVRLLRAYPSPWQVNVARPEAPAQTECVARLPERPPYRELEGLLRAVPWSMSAKPIGERLALEAKWVRQSLAPLPQSQQLEDDR